MGCAAGEGGHAAPVALVRDVVLPGQPLALSNPQDEAVTWPIWGGAFTLEEVVTLRVALGAGEGARAGIVLAAPGDPETRRAVELVYEGGARWCLRETEGEARAQELTFTAPRSTTFLLR